MEYFKRTKYLDKIEGFINANDIIKVLTGIRRCGKSTIMQIIASELIKNGVPEQNVIFIDLDDTAYRKIKNEDDLENLILEKNKQTTTDTTYLFIDEIQNIKNFEEVINGFRNSGNYSIFITGSNSYLLSGELITKLVGRYIEFEIYPLSFDEYIEMKKFYKIDINHNLLIELTQFIVEGGFPRTVTLKKKSDKRAYVESLVDEIFDKDIKRRVKIRDTEAFEIVRRYIINNFGVYTSITNICNALNEEGHNISRATITRYIQVLIDAKILYPCNRFDLKSKKSLKNEKKYYLADLSLYYSQNTDNRPSYGPNLENLVYIYSKGLNYKISVGRIGNLECDFILRDTTNNYAYVQVSYTILSSKKTEDIEFKSLEQIKDNYPKFVMTTDYMTIQRNGIKHVNIMDFMVNNCKFD